MGARFLILRLAISLESPGSFPVPLQLFVEQEALSHDEPGHHNKSVSDEADWSKRSEVIGLETAFELPEGTGSGEKKINMRPSLGGFSEQEKRSQREFHFSLPAWEEHRGCKACALMEFELKSQGIHPKFHSLCPGVACAVYEGTRKKDQGSWGWGVLPLVYALGSFPTR